jgi:thioredoxin reductase
LKKYSVPIKRTNIITASKTVNGNFIVTDRKGVTFQSRKLIIATGLTDRLPSLKGIKKFYGKSIFHCPYCDGWEVKDRKIAIYSENKNGVELALSLKTWSHTITLFTNGNNYLKSPDRKLLKQYNIQVVTEKIENLLGKAGKLQFILLGTKKRLPCDAMFLATGYAQHSNLAEDLGCLVSKQHVVITRKSGRTNIPGLYVVGDASWDIHLAIIAASEGAKAGVYINKQIQKEEKQQIITTQKILA